MPNTVEPQTTIIEFSTLGDGNVISRYTPETIKHDSKTKRNSFTDRFGAMVGITSKD